MSVSVPSVRIKGYILGVSGTGTKKVTPNENKTIKSSTFGQKYFEVDHPFIFMVWDYYSGMFLLMGRVMNPDIIPT